MTSRPRVSVCMATYNGAAFVDEQIASILSQLEEDDELIVVDDASGDATASIIEGRADPRITIQRSSVNRGYVRSFATALEAASGDLLFLADQDDVWMPGRIDAMALALEKNEIVASNLLILGSDKAPWWSFHEGMDHRPRRNVVRILAGLSGYYGCGMAMRRSALEVVLPFPSFLFESHDLWIAIAGNELQSIQHLVVPTLWRRVHATNSTPTRPRRLDKVLAARVLILRSVVVIAQRIHRRNSPRSRGPCDRPR